MKSIGIDLAGFSKNPTGLAIFEFNKDKIKTMICHDNEEILKIIYEENPDIIAIDAPFSFPTNGYFRKSEIALKRAGFKPLSPLFRGMRPLVERAIKIVKILREKNFNVIEVLSSAIKKVLMTDDKIIKSKYPYASKDEIDAILCALTGKLFLEGKTKAYGNEINDKIIIPQIKGKNDVKKRYAALLSGGKDSVYALYKAIKNGYDVPCIITMKSKRDDSWMFHVPSIDMVDYISKCVEIPFIKRETSGIKEKELNDLKSALLEVKEKFKIDGIIVGALASNYQNDRINKLADELGLKVFAPLWKKNQEDYMRNLLKEGFAFTLVSITCDGLKEKFLGKVLTRDDIEEIIELSKKYGFNPAFEGGEAETLVLDAPIYKKRIEIEYQIIKKSEYEIKLNITGVKLIDKLKK